jgi:hypothetical protein
MTAANIDGSGRQIKLIRHTDGIMIEAGCFVGTLGEFVERANNEGKTRYASIITAIAEVL